MTANADFIWSDQPSSTWVEGSCVARLPLGIRSKQTLLKCLGRRLHLPGWFGGNWDALEDSLRDLSWLPEGQGVAIVHADLPFGAGESRQIYFAILRSAIAHWIQRGDRKFTVVFPAAAQQRLSGDE